MTNMKIRAPFKNTPVHQKHPRETSAKRPNPRLFSHLAS